MGIAVARFVISLLWVWPGHAEVSASTTKYNLEQTAIAFFSDNANPLTGLVLDHSSNFKANPADNTVASIAATGFGFAVMANAAWRGSIAPKIVQDYILGTLRFARDHVARHNGWFLHFFDWQTGNRVWASEYSTIDTALFIAGALYAGEIFPQSEIREMAHRLYADLDFTDAMTDGGKSPGKRTLSMAYTPEFGYTSAQWNMYAEEMILLLLGLGHPDHPLPPESWLAWSRDLSKLPSSSESVMGFNQGLFVHQYSQLFVDFRSLHDGYGNYHQNSVILTRYQRELLHMETSYQTLRDGFWGFSAGLDPITGYQVYTPPSHVGTVCIGCVAGSAMFLPAEILADASQWLNGPYHEKIWGKYGFVDSLDIDRHWFADEVLAITVGPAYLSLANTDPQTSIWRVFMNIPEIQLAMKRAQLARPSATRRTCSTGL